MVAPSAVPGPQLALLDVIDLQLTHASTGVNPSAGSPPSTTRMKKYGTPSGFGGNAINGGDDDDESDDDEDDWLESLSASLHWVQLHAAADSAGHFWACHDHGAWGINITWLPVVAKYLAHADSDGHADVSAELDLDRTSPSSPLQQLPQLPPPLIQELLVTDERLVGSCPVGNVLMRSGCVVLRASGVVEYLRPWPAVSGHGGTGDGAGDGTAAAAAGEDEAVQGGLDASALKATLQVMSMIERCI